MHCPNTPIILVGNKLDLKHDQQALDRLRAKGQTPVSTEDGKAMAKTINATGFVECSALTQENIAKVMDTAIRACLSPGSASKKAKAKKEAKDKPSEPTPPSLPKQERAPWTYITDSSFSADLGRLLDSQTFADIEFKCGKKSIHAHKVILCTTGVTSIFRRIFSMRTKADKAKKLSRISTPILDLELAHY